MEINMSAVIQYQPTYTKITSTSHGHIALKDSVINWYVNPVILTEEEFNTFDLSIVMNILRNPQVPSARARLKEKKLYDVVKQIDGKFRQLLDTYTKKLKEASNKDRLVLLEKNKVKIGTILLDGLKSLLSGRFFDFIYKIIGAYFIAINLRQQISKRGSTHRIAWLQQIGAREEERLEDAKQLLEMRCATLIKDCEDEIKKGNLLTNNLKEIEQLSQLFRSIFPGQLFMVGKRKIDAIEYLNRNKQLISM